MSETVALEARPTIPALALLLIAQAALQLLDLTTTFLAMQGGAVEANPVSRAVIEGPGWWAYGALKVTLAAAFLGLWPLTCRLSVGERRLVGAAMGSFAAIMVAVVVNNAWILL